MSRWSRKGWQADDEAEQCNPNNYDENGMPINLEEESEKDYIGEYERLRRQLQKKAKRGKRLF